MKNYFGLVTEAYNLTSGPIVGKRVSKLIDQVKCHYDMTYKKNINFLKCFFVFHKEEEWFLKYMLELDNVMGQSSKYVF